MASDPIRIFWTNTDNSGGSALIANFNFASYDADGVVNGNGIFNVDFAALDAAPPFGYSGPWTGKQVKQLIIQPGESGTNFSLDYVQLRNSGFATSDTAPTAALSAAITVSAPPIVELLKPSIKGGESLKAWNFIPGDVGFSVNLRSDADPSKSNETYSTYLPDVRTEDGLRGDFYKGTNISGNDDPNDYMNFPFFTSNTFTIDADAYRNMCLKLRVDKEFDLGLGSVTKFIYQKAGAGLEQADAWATIYDRWSGSKWYEYCFDMSNHPTEDGVVTWGGIIDAFRLDPHEFHKDTCCDQNGAPIGNPISVSYYYDYLKIRKDDTSHGKYAIVTKASDADTASVTNTYYYNATKSLSGGTAIAPSDLQCEGRVCIWNTAGVPVGTYYLSVTSSDGADSTSALATGRLKVDNSGATDTAPVLSIEAPLDGATVCSSMQVKGYSLLTQRFEDVSAVQVFVDGTYFASVDLGVFSPKAKQDYPAADSSNAGFDSLFDITSLSAGSHSLSIKAYSSDGGITTYGPISITRNPGCTDGAPISDPAPAGVPVAITPITFGTPTPAPPPADSPVITLSHKANGGMSAKITKIGDAGQTCKITLQGSATSDGTYSVLKTYAVPAKALKAKKLAMSATGVQVAKKSVPSVYVRAERVCNGTSVTGAAVQLKFKTAKGAKNTAAALKQIKKLKIPKASAKRRR